MEFHTNLIWIFIFYYQAMLHSTNAMNVVAIIESCWEESVPYIERVGKSDDCYQDDTELSCYKFANNLQSCGDGWDNTVIRTKREFNYIVTKAKHHLTPPSTFTVKIRTNKEIVLDIAETECVTTPVYSDLPKFACATFEIRENGYRLTITRTGRGKPCKRHPDEVVLCYTDTNEIETTTVTEYTTNPTTLKTSQDSYSPQATLKTFYTSYSTPKTSTTLHTNYSLEVVPRVSTSTSSVTMMLKNELMGPEVFAIISSCWVELSPYIESVGEQTDRCYIDGVTGERQCYKFENNKIDGCGNGWKESVVRSKKEFDYIISKAKYHLRRNSTFTIKMDLESMKMQKFVSKFTSECVEKNIDSDVMMKKDGCASLEILEYGYKMTISKLSKDNPCKIKPNDEVVCSLDTWNIMTTKPAIGFTSPASHVQPSSDTLPISLMVMVASVSVFVIIVLALGCFCFGKYKERKINQALPVTYHTKPNDVGIVIPMQQGIANTTYEYPYEPEPLYAAINDGSPYMDVLRSRSETALNFGSEPYLPKTRSLQRIADSKWNTTGRPNTRTYKTNTNAGSKTLNTRNTSAFGGDLAPMNMGRKFNSEHNIPGHTQEISDCNGSFKDLTNYKQTGSAKDIQQAISSVIVDKDGYLKVKVEEPSDDGMYLQPITDRVKLNDSVTYTTLQQSSDEEMINGKLNVTYTTLQPSCEQAIDENISESSAYTSLEPPCEHTYERGTAAYTNLVHQNIDNQKSLELSTYMPLQIEPKEGPNIKQIHTAPQISEEGYARYQSENDSDYLYPNIK